jgi:Histidine kinase
VSRNRTRFYWLCQVVGWFSWTILGVLYATAGGMYAPSWSYAVTYGGSAIVAIAWTHGYRHFIKRRGWAALEPGALLARVIPASLVLGIVLPYTDLPLYALVYQRSTELFGRWTLAAILGTSWSVLVWNFAYFGIHYFERWRQAELDKLQLAVVAGEAQLHGLMAQLNPHFLFNCLNSVRGLIVEDPAKAQTAVTQLSDLMRYSMHASRIPTVALDTELEMVRTYLALQAVRFDERLRTTLDIAPATRAVQVPTMLVQALVENGVKHGIEQVPAGGTLAIAAWLEGDALRVRVTNPGQITPRDGSTQVGLANARERLRLLYGARAQLALREAGGEVVAELTVPIGGGA